MSNDVRMEATLTPMANADTEENPTMMSLDATAVHPSRTASYIASQEDGHLASDPAGESATKQISFGDVAVETQQELKPRSSEVETRGSESSTTNRAVGVITLKVKKSKIAAFDAWYNTISKVCETFKGFACRDRQDWSIDDKYVGISILITFETDQDLIAWNSSGERLERIDAAKKLGLFAERRSEVKDKELPFVQMTRFESSACKSPKVLPPPKWKLWLIVWALVTTTTLAASEAKVRQGLMHGGWLEFEPALFVQLFITVTLIIFAYSPLLTAIEFRGYGLAAWLKLPRLHVSTKPGVRFADLRVVLSGITEVMNNGFSLFNPPPSPPVPPEVLKRISTLEGRLAAFKRRTTARLLDLEGVDEDHPHFEPQTDVKKVRESVVDIYATDLMTKLRSAPTRDPNEPLTITTHHRVKWERMEEFDMWQVRIASAMTKFEGFRSIRRITPSQWDDNLYTLIFRFSSLETMSAWLHSDERIDLLTEMQPLLEVPDQYEASQNRVLPDAFSDTLVGQGEGVSRRPPPKWKVTIITTMALFLTAWPLGWHMPRHLRRWGVTGKHAQIVVQAGFSTLVNIYLTTPFFYNLFGYWIVTPLPSHFSRYPWRLLDVGLKNPLSMTLAVFLYFLGCGLKINADKD